ncbi:uncharacterized protein EAF01_002694 [Botrytis porri]|uniref:2EXR domain-containing protein n=1 Tax=Botrytis porri TaxID=87229 RepID=A0A4Z1KM20_9HELO|nr:uncharacterized protein EAF01_002694 [Botrytis porri]KAF7911186.1 hypothetical protein EAF01_002694 [Botrytis porri]TGO85342.1 hypothetical protein BPOR_0406g00060 [Botrytis porri]
MASSTPPSLRFMNHPHITHHSTHHTRDRNWHLSVTITSRKRTAADDPPTTYTPPRSDSPLIPDSASPERPAPPHSFHSFPRLPTELQTHIWTLAAKDIAPRDITICHEPCEFEGYASIIEKVIKCLVNLLTIGREKRVDYECSAVPALIHTNYLARSIARKVYRRWFQEALNRKIYVGMEDRVVVVSRPA